jgi:hypothetical protein
MRRKIVVVLASLVVACSLATLATAAEKRPGPFETATVVVIDADSGTYLWTQVPTRALLRDQVVLGAGGREILGFRSRADRINVEGAAASLRSALLHLGGRPLPEEMRARFLQGSLLEAEVPPPKEGGGRTQCDPPVCVRKYVAPSNGDIQCLGDCFDCQVITCSS